MQVAGATAVSFSALQRFAKAGAGDRAVSPYGSLRADPEKLLDLPRGFSYSVISKSNTKMTDGLMVPGAPDGMAAFAGPRGTTLLLRNHELNPRQGGPFGKDNGLSRQVSRSKLYDDGGGETPGCGAVTTIVYDTRRKKVIREFLSLGGTEYNCAGGPTPWGSWITCEETVKVAGVDRRHKITRTKDHGYNFEVPASDKMQMVDPVPLKAMGRFKHEAVAVHPATSIVYQTEDVDDGLIYRFIPDFPRRLARGGKLQALSVEGHASLDARNWTRQTVRVGQRMRVRWTDLDRVDTKKDDLRYRGFKAGATRFARGEGMWYATDGVYFCSTTGGRKKNGQIWKYVPSKYEGGNREQYQQGTLELFVESDDSDLMKNGDNMCASPWGDLIICEDHSGVNNRLIGLTEKGEMYTLASTPVESEFAGICFSPDKSTMFVNLWEIGLTFAVTGPWRRR